MIYAWYYTCVESQVQKHEIELKFGLDIELNLAWLMNQAKPSWAQVWTIFLGLYQTQAKLEHSTFAVEPRLNIHYSTKLDLFTALGLGPFEPSLGSVSTLMCII